jgi:tRNA-specific 2-thiouridylase
MKVLAAMSGGVDSSVAAARAVDAGHEVVGVHLALSAQPGTLRTGARGCCTKEDAADARRVADVVDIPFYVWDFAQQFTADVVDDFVAEYAAGRTPNPCLRCNERIKFTALLDRARDLGFDAVCTGHYARLADGVLRRAVDAGKDQSYVLAGLTAEQLAHALFPVGDTAKGEIRAEATRRGLASIRACMALPSDSVGGWDCNTQPPMADLDSSWDWNRPPAGCGWDPRTI